jgi:hypothetical protein
VLAAGGVAVALVLLAGCLVTANARPLAAAPGHGGGMTEGTGLLTPHYGPQRILYRHRPGGIGEFSVVVTNRSWTRDVTITGVASASLAPGPWRLRIPPADRGARAHAPIAVPSLDERTVPLELRFVPCAAGDRGQTFTLDTVPLVVAPGGGPAVQHGAARAADRDRLSLTPPAQTVGTATAAPSSASSTRRMSPATHVKIGVSRSV